ncbi:MAG: endolytic transglycosylase MltG [Bacteroidetes bacterium]|nr:endolytic transglycosylase MltG [Bacteroidota bacterium]
MAKKKKNILKKIILWLLPVFLLGGGVAAYIGYRMLYLPNVSLGEEKSKIIFIPTGSNYEDVLAILAENKILKDEKSFARLAELKKYKDKVKPGRYRILNHISNNELINLLRAGLQEPVTVTFNNIRTKEQLISRICKKLEADSTELFALLNNDHYLKENLGLRSETALTLFIPNTYEFNWNTSAKQFMERMQTEYKKFWTEERKRKAKEINLTQTQVSILASIVQAEQLQFPDERPSIAGLYLNRLKIGMALQSDPTVIYAIGDFSINRVLDKDKEIDSPYNTYKHAGLPPGPIYIPEISSIDGVLNYQKNDCLYMCAKEDFSGKHNFAKTLAEHNRNAEKYRNALNKNKILR